MRFHVVGLPHTQITEAFSSCAYTEKVRKFCIMMMNLGHEVYLYAGEENTAPCTEHICCISETDRLKAVGVGHYTTASFDPSLPHWIKFNTKVTAAIADRLQKEDFLCVIAGLANESIAKALPQLTCVEFGIGYSGTFSNYRVWESYAWMHTVYGAQQGAYGADGKWFDEVIPGYLEPEKFEFVKEKGDYFLYIGRMIDRKGWSIAQDVCLRTGDKLIYAGQPKPENLTYGEYVGQADPAMRSKLMSNAKAVFVPTLYVEPFGNVAVEAMACGTPVICTDWGAMTETVIEGFTGYRCRSMQEFVDATKKVKFLNPEQIRDYAVNRYGLAPIGHQYQAYFERLLTLWGDGWNTVK